ncbi:DUF4845 domain-containing protein [Endozoicomonadaceae bacterium StTr2]
MTRSVVKQRGFSGLLWLIFLLLAGFAGLVGMKAGPTYYDDYAIGQAVASVAEQPELATASRQDVRAWLERALQTQLVELPEDAVLVSANRNDVSIRIDYERRVNLLMNIDLVMTFEHHRVFNR